MNKKYRIHFGFKKEPFPNRIKENEIHETAQVGAVETRFSYTLDLGGICTVTGDIGSGKTTAIRYAASKLHKAEYNVYYVTATSGSILELYRQIIEALGIENPAGSRARMISTIKNEILELVSGKRINALLIIDEASLLRMEVLAELHTLVQFRPDTGTSLSVILAGQPTLIDKLVYRTSSPLASRIVARSHLEGLELQGMKEYLLHHLKIAGVEHNLFTEPAITAIHQGSGGYLRKANHLARGSLIAAATANVHDVTAEHVQKASSELF